MSSLTLKKRAIRGAVWTILGYGTSQVLRFGSNLILTRLLVPEFFGLMAVVNTLRIGLELFSDLGIGQSIVQNKQGDDAEFLNTAWTAQIIRGFLLWIACLLLTPLVAGFYNDQRLLIIVPIVGFTTVIDGFMSTSVHSLHRTMNLGRYTIFELIVQFLSLVVLVVWSWLSPTVWALAFGGLAGAAFRTIGSYWLEPDQSNRLAWNQEAIRELFSFGKWIFLSTAMMFLAEQADRLILGKLLSFEILGIYTIAYTLANVPREVIKQVSHRVIFPTISQQNEISRASLRHKIIRQRWRILIGFAVFLAALTSVGDLIIAVLYDERYRPATWMLPILCCGIWFSVLFYTMSPALLALGKPIYSAQSNAARLTAIAVGLPLTFSMLGIPGAIAIVAFSDFLPYLVVQYGLLREQLFCLSQDLWMTGTFVGILSFLLWIRYTLGFGFPLDSLFN